MCPHSRAYVDALIAQSACPGCLIEENRMLRDRIDQMRHDHALVASGLQQHIDALTNELARVDLIRPRVIMIPREMFDV